MHFSTLAVYMSTAHKVMVTSPIRTVYQWKCPKIPLSNSCLSHLLQLTGWYTALRYENQDQMLTMKLRYYQNDTNAHAQKHDVCMTTCFHIMFTSILIVTLVAMVWTEPQVSCVRLDFCSLWSFQLEVFNL